ncbi:hypothetical protein RB195_025135 [Necator americanus]|uniref:Uncharacterized protein n=1 Tax=Necator americanus TaxID=51031 RepID=A0ABR1ER27_NECAM
MRVQRWDFNNNPICLKNGSTHEANIGQRKSSDIPLRADESHNCIHVQERHQLKWQGMTPLTPEEKRKRKMPTLELQLDYVLTKKIRLSDIRKSIAVWYVVFDSNHRPVLVSSMVRFRKGVVEFNINRSWTWQV